VCASPQTIGIEGPRMGANRVSVARGHDFTTSAMVARPWRQVLHG
jgi:hypothetical protein